YGEMTTTSSGGQIIMTSEWGRPVHPHNGSGYEVRMTANVGTTTDGDDLEVWLPLTEQRSWGVTESGTNLNFVGTLEIRPNGGTVVDSATIILASIADEEEPPEGGVVLDSYIPVLTEHGTQFGVARLYFYSDGFLDIVGASLQETIWYEEPIEGIGDDYEIRVT